MSSNSNRTVRNSLITIVCGAFIFSCAWFCLWAISYYFLQDPMLAILFFPFAFRLGVVLHAPKNYWLPVYFIEWGLIFFLGSELHFHDPLLVVWLSFISLLACYVFIPFYKGKQWQKLGGSGLLILGLAIINTLILNCFPLPLPENQYWLANITGGLMLVPSCYLIWSYLFEYSWVPLSVDLIGHKITFRARHITWYALLFILNIGVQTGLPDELRRFAPFCLAIPIVFLAFRYGWQGALLGTLLNSIALIAVRSGHVQPDSGNYLETTDLLLSLMAQTLTGICLGLGIQRQRELNISLRSELDRNHNLVRQLIQTEETIRRSIARELHDEIGQNITAIRTQANIIQRIDDKRSASSCAHTIENLSLNIYDTTKTLLTQLRPKTIDDLGIKDAILQLIRDMEFSGMGVDVKVNWHSAASSPAFSELNDLSQITIYRITQEALNNALKYANADNIVVNIYRNRGNIRVSIKDDGDGFALLETKSGGFGLQGMQERVQALGGSFSLTSHPRKLYPIDHGTYLSVLLPII